MTGESTDQTKRGLVEDVQPVGWRFYPYGTDSDDEPLFSFWMDLGPDTGVCLFERGGDGGRWLDTHHADDDYEPVRPSEELREILHTMLVTDRGVKAERVESLPAYERYFVQSVVGTLEDRKDLPGGVWAFLEHCAEGPLEVVDDVE